MFGGEGNSFLFSKLSGGAGEIGSTVVISGGCNTGLKSRSPFSGQNLLYLYRCFRTDLETKQIYSSWFSLRR